MRHGLVYLAFVVFGLIATQARAGGCTIATGLSPFADVPNASTFCTEVLWLRNANVTTGCGNGTIYCPSDPVTRAQMALFMKRLARGITPDVVYSATPSGAGDIDGNGYSTCVTDPYTVPATNANVRILGHASGNVSVLTDGAADMFVAIQMSTNGGLFSTLGVNPPRALVPGNQWTVVPVISAQTMTLGSGAILVPGSTYRWQILLQRAGGATTGEVTSNRCQLMIHLPVDATFL